MPPSIRRPDLKRTYDEAIDEGEASEMEGMIKALVRALEEKKLRAKEARKEAERAREEAARVQDDVDTAQQLLDDANRKQKHMFIAERSKGK